MPSEYDVLGSEDHTFRMTDDELNKQTYLGQASNVTGPKWDWPEMGVILFKLV